jgi:hypothetical protein
MAAELAPVEQVATKERTSRVYQLLGAIKASGLIGRSVSAQEMRMLQRFQEEKGHEELGFTRFDDFLDQSPDAPMTYRQYNERIKVLNIEGDETFELMNSLRIPISKRRLLGKGEVEVEGKEIRVGEQAFNLDDTGAVIEAFRVLAQTSAEKERTIGRQKKQLDQGQKDFDALKRSAIFANPHDTTSGQALLQFSGAARHLEQVLEDAPAEERQAIQDAIFDVLTHTQLTISAALGLASKEEIKSATSDEIGLQDDELPEEVER